ncbi:MAG: toll/interleukin-1 receptor domain-containing protein [Proteobacteria bacterium]|nr:toll/interleukin-1 receptor domain-containing protein [Pseudomonadota bacterium]
MGEVMATLADIFRHQGRGEILEMLESAHAHFDEINYDNWNGGTYTWALRLEVPVPFFATLEARLTAIEKEIEAKLSYIGRLHPNDPVGEVTITPITPGASVLGQRMAPSELEVRRLWPEGRLRLFLSHVSSHRVAVSKLKAELALRGVAAFVAHEDIEPSLQWRDEIELGLRSMHALAALITPDFHASVWTDQEIGWALGRGVLVVPVRLGVDPYGFAGKFQGVPGSLDKPEKLADAIVAALLANPQTHGEMRRSLVSAFAQAESFLMAMALRTLLVEIKDFTEEEITAMRTACVENDQVAKAYHVARDIYAAVGKPPAPKPVEANEDVPF